MSRLFKIFATFFIALFLFYSPTAFSEDKATEEKEGSLNIEGIEVIQNRLFTKKFRHELSLSMGILYDNNFFFYEMLPVQYTFYPAESIGIELTAAFAFGQEKALVDSLAQQGLTVQYEKIKRYYSGNFIWSPIYGKFNVFASQILHFDFFLTTGFGLMQNSVTVSNDSVQHYTFNIGAGIKVYTNEWLALRMDFRNYTWKEGKPFNDIANNRILSLGASVLFPFHKRGK